MSKSVDLYKVAYRINANGEIRRIDEMLNLKQAQKIVDNCNTRHSGECEYFVEQVNYNSLSEEMIQSLIDQGKLILEPASLSR
ncbi:MAG TPA: hypothetical protein V6C84_05150 [Coleofasciculaceae cyanobacterium]|jgi:hypothetical protein